MNRDKKKRKIDKTVPRYNAALFLLLPFIIYSALNFTFVGTMFAKEIMDYGSNILPNIELLNAIDRDDMNIFLSGDVGKKIVSPEERVKRIYFRDIVATFLCMWFLIVLFNLPIKIYFVKKRRLEKCNKFLINYSKRVINYSPEIITGLVLLGSIYIHRSLYTLLISLSEADAMFDLVKNILTISIFTSFLVLLLIYFGQKYRVQTKYIHHIFSKKRLAKLPRGFNFPGLRGRFFITTIFLTFIPLVIVLFYVLSSFKTLNNLSGLTEGQIDILFGDIFDFISVMSKRDPRDVLSSQLSDNHVNYIDVFGVLQLYMGIIPGLFFSFIYIFQIVKWSNSSILMPIRELLEAMKNVSKGDLNTYAIVRSREETGRLAYGFNKMLNGLKDRERIKSLFGQYLSAEVSEEILKGNIDLNGNMYKATILFADIRGFTTLSEGITPAETIDFLNEYYNVLIGVIQEFGGIVDKFMGDGILVLFGVPIESKDHADRAVAAAFKIQERLKEFNEDRAANNLFTVKVGVGIHTGEVIAGNVGNNEKLEYTVVGDTVNAASRIENLTKKFETDVLIGETVYESMAKSNSDKKRFKKLEGVTLRGKKMKVNLLKAI